jgi:CubicO group peptidase (beta-lactamase class C family)
VRLISSACFLLLALAAFGAGPSPSPLPVAKPEQVGLSSDRLKKVHDLIERYRQNGDIAGAVTVVSRRGKLAHFEAQGFSDLEARKPMRTDDILRIASMTKPIATVGALMLLEEQRFLLEEPISKYLPEFRQMKVGPQAVPAEREITIHDLFSHRSGLSAGRGRQPVNSLADFSKNLASNPLLFHPGAGWQYGPSTDLLGHLVEVLSGQTLDQFLRARILAPLGMNDTYFRLPAEKSARLAPVYQKTNGKLQKVTTLSNVLEQPPYFSASGGLLSTAPDYARFCQMLVNGGELDGHRYLSRKTPSIERTALGCSMRTQTIAKLMGTLTLTAIRSSILRLRVRVYLSSRFRALLTIPGLPTRSSSFSEAKPVRALAYPKHKC